MRHYAITVTYPVRQIVYVDADSATDAKRIAREGGWEDSEQLDIVYPIFAKVTSCIEERDEQRA